MADITSEELWKLSAEKGDLFWYWVNKAKNVDKFTGLDVIRFITKNCDNSDLNFVREFLLGDYNLDKLYGRGQVTPEDRFEFTTWELIAKTMSWVGDLMGDLYNFATEGEWPFILTDKVYSHQYRFQLLYDAWIAHYMRMYHKDEDIVLDPWYSYPENFYEIPWWSV